MKQAKKPEFKSQANIVNISNIVESINTVAETYYKVSGKINNVFH